MDLSNLRSLPGSRRKRKRVGRGPGSGHGKTCCRGHKGQKARGCGKVALWFEGGQMPLQRRLPKRGFHSRNRVESQIVSLGRLGTFSAGEVVDLESLLSRGLVTRVDRPVKILGEGEVQVPLTVRVPAISAGARAKITAAGGTVEII